MLEYLSRIVIVEDEDDVLERAVGMNGEVFSDGEVQPADAGPRRSLNSRCTIGQPDERDISISPSIAQAGYRRCSWKSARLSGAMCRRPRIDHWPIRAPSSQVMAEAC
jgi:hypothetical protein